MLRRGFEVYIPLVDDQHANCGVRGHDGEGFDVQTKARSDDCIPFDARISAAMGIPYPRGNDRIIFYSERAGCHCILTSLKPVELVSQSKQGANVEKYHIDLTGWSKERDQIHPAPWFDEHKDSFSLLAGAEREAE